jgi:hypothetical protein
MKFSYDFKLSEHSGSSRVYVCGDITARIDFLSGSMMRVALFRDDCKMLPTFTVDPQNEFLTEGRDKLSLDGFSLFVPQVNETADGERFSLGNVEAELNTQASGTTVSDSAISSLNVRFIFCLSSKETANKLFRRRSSISSDKFPERIFS